LGMIIALHPAAAGSCLAIFWIVFLATNYVSLASMLASISFPLMIVVELFGQENPMVVWFGVVMCGLVIVTHRKNIIRLAQGNESKIYLFGKREQEA
jgi:acyl phosphate:glycerol-3-phosphate acyltransferase